MTLESGRQAEVQDAYRAAAAAGRESGTPEGLEIAARALLALADFLAQEPTGDAVEVGYRAAVEAGREAGTPEGLEIAARALLALANLLAHDPTGDAVEAAYLAAAAADRKFGGSSRSA